MTTATLESKATSLLSGNKIDLSHQEMDRLLHALEELYNDTKASTPALEWMPMTGVGNLLAQELGYEDMDEFEDAIGGSFQDFLRNFPHVEIKEDARFTDGLVFKVHPDPPASEWRPRKLTFRVQERGDLWRVCHKSSHGCIAIPHMEFEISADGNRIIDTLYNHISRAVFSLTSHAGPTGTDDLGAGVREKILETVEELNKLLDVEEPFELVITDPSGISELKPDDGVVAAAYDPSAE